MSGADRVIKWSTAGAVLGVAAVAAVASYEHAYDLVRAHGEFGWTARMVPLTVDGLIYASSMVMLDSARRKTAVPALARWLGLGIAATLAANVAHGLGHGPVGAVVAAWPAVALGRQAQATELFTEDLAAARAPSIRAIRESLRVMDDPSTANDVESELADVLQYLIRLADILGVDLAEAVRRKMRLNESLGVTYLLRSDKSASGNPCA